MTVQDRSLEGAWGMTALIFLFMFINFADKAVLGLAAQPLMADLKLSPEQFGLIGSAFFLLFPLSAVLVGLTCAVLGVYVVQRRLGVDLGLALAEPLPPHHSRQAAEVTRRLMQWALLPEGKGRRSGVHERVTERVRCSDLHDPKLPRLLPKSALAKLREEIEMAKGLCPPFDPRAYREGHLTPVFFGSALNNFGVRELLHGVAELAPAPRPQPAQGTNGPRPISPEEPQVAGFVFKVQANIDPQHRDRIAFVRLASGRFQRGMKLKNIRTGRLMSVQAPVFFLARERNLAEEAWPGDIIGIPNHGSLRIGDTLTESEALRITGIPSFAPEILRRVKVEDPMKTKHLRHALEQLAEEGVTRVFKPLAGGDWIIGVVGALQLDVLTARLAAEYDLATRLDGAPFQAARWLEADDRTEIERFRNRNPSASAEDHDGVPVFLARNAWDLRTTIEEWPGIRFTETREQN